MSACRDLDALEGIDLELRHLAEGDSGRRALVCADGDRRDLLSLNGAEADIAHLGVRRFDAGANPDLSGGRHPKDGNDSRTLGRSLDDRVDLGIAIEHDACRCGGRRLTGYADAERVRDNRAVSDRLGELDDLYVRVDGERCRRLGGRGCLNRDAGPARRHTSAGARGGEELDLKAIGGVIGRRRARADRNAPFGEAIAGQGLQHALTE